MSAIVPLKRPCPQLLPRELEHFYENMKYFLTNFLLLPLLICFVSTCYSRKKENVDKFGSGDSGALVTRSSGGSGRSWSMDLNVIFISF
jgi:hypothetical protein